MSFSTSPRPFGMAAARQGLPVRLDRAPQRGAAFAITRASRRTRTRSIGSRSRARGSSLIFDHPPAVAPPPSGHGLATRPQGQERLAECPSDAGGRDTRAATPAARTGGILARLYDRAGRTDDAQGLPCAIRWDRGSRQNALSDPSAHAAPRLRLRPGERRPRHTGAASLAGAQEYSTHGALHRAVAASVQGLLALKLRETRNN